VEFGEYAFAEGWIDEPPNVLNPINGAIVVGVMILPLIASMSEDALRAVPNELREGSLALGATKIETTFKVMIQASLSGIIASIILALSRAVGETMAVTLAVGTVAVYTSNMFLPAQTMTAYIAQRVGGDLPFGEIGYLTIFAVGLYLFVITLCLNLLGNKVLSAYREAY
jgi:ABC-type phosphate transport system, permease component